MGVIDLVLKFVWSRHVWRRLEVKLTLVLVVVALQFVRRRPVCFVRRPQILAVCMHHVPSKMVLLSIPKVVLVARVIARLSMVCFARLQ